MKMPRMSAMGANDIITIAGVVSGMEYTIGEVEKEKENENENSSEFESK